MAIGLTFRIKEVEGFYDLCSQNRGVYLRLVFASAKIRFSHDVAHLIHTLPILLNKMSRVVRKPVFRICENKDTDQLIVTAKLISAFVFAT